MVQGEAVGGNEMLLWGRKPSFVAVTGHRHRNGWSVSAPTWREVSGDT